MPRCLRMIMISLSEAALAENGERPFELKEAARLAAVRVAAYEILFPICWEHDIPDEIAHRYVELELMALTDMLDETQARELEELRTQYGDVLGETTKTCVFCGECDHCKDSTAPCKDELSQKERIERGVLDVLAGASRQQLYVVLAFCPIAHRRAEEGIVMQGKFVSNFDESRFGSRYMPQAVSSLQGNCDFDDSLLGESFSECHTRIANTGMIHTVTEEVFEAAQAHSAPFVRHPEFVVIEEDGYTRMYWLAGMRFVCRTLTEAEFQSVMSAMGMSMSDAVSASLMG